MRIVHVRSTSGFYGAEAVVVSLAQAQSDAGARPRVISLHAATQADDEFVEKLSAQRIEAESLPMKGRLDLRVIRQLASRFVQLNADVVHLHGYKEDLYGLPAARLARCAAVVTNHLWNGNDWKVRCYERIDAFVLKKMALHIVAVSSALKAEMVKSGVPKERIAVIHNAVPQSFLSPIAARVREVPPDAPLVVATCARLAPEKGHRFMLDACRLLFASGVAIRWRVAGDGALRAWLEESVRSEGLTHQVSIEGYVSDIQTLLSEVDVVVQPSLNEGLPIALLEAMARGLPVVGTAVGAVPDLIEHGVTGLLVPPANPRALAEALMLLRAPELRRSLGLAARSHVSTNFTAARMAERYAAVYDAALLAKKQTLGSAP